MSTVAMSDQSVIINRLLALYQEADRAEDSDMVATKSGGIVSDYNDLFPDLQNQFPDVAEVDSLERIQTGGTLSRQAAKVGKVKANLRKVIFALGLELPSQEGDDRTGQSSPPVNVNIENSPTVQQSQNQSARQSMEQYISIRDVTDSIGQQNLSEEDEAVLRQIVEEFEQNLDESDPSKVSRLIQKASDYSVDVAAKMGMLALQDGMVELLL